MKFLAILVCLLVVLQLDSQCFSEDGRTPNVRNTTAAEWSYSSSSTDNGFTRPVSRSFTMTPAHPEDVELPEMNQELRRDSSIFLVKIRYF